MGSICVIIPNFAAIGQTVAEIWRFSIFQNGELCDLGFLKFLNFNDRQGGGVNMLHRAKFHGDRSNHYRDIAIFLFSRWPIFGILKFGM